MHRTPTGLGILVWMSIAYFFITIKNAITFLIWIIKGKMVTFKVTDVKINECQDCHNRKYYEFVYSIKGEFEGKEIISSYSHQERKIEKHMIPGNEIALKYDSTTNTTAWVKGLKKDMLESLGVTIIFFFFAFLLV